ncbi:MAG: 50S ribosomal protein L20 [Candidatus Spechtbacteria bacterium]|nr:50S ribosomal protein L20 [Candidatus Spechtbacteria bacterium]
MTRVKRGTVRAKKRKSLLIHVKGFKWRRKNVYRLAKEALMHARAAMFKGRKQRKRDARRLWNVQVNAASRIEGLTYSKLIHGMKEKNIEVDRKILAELAKTKPEVFKAIVEKAR